MREQHLLSDAVGLQTLAIHIERYLLFLLAIDTHIGHRGNTAQTVRQLVGIRLQLTIAALRTLYRNQQGRRVAEVVVGYQGQHATGQRRLKQVQAVLDFRPHLVLVIHFIVQANHHDTHAILRSGSRLCTVHLAICKEVALQGFCHLFLYLLAGSARIDGHHHSLTDGECRKLILGHHVHAVDTHHKQDADNEQRYRVMLQWPTEPRHLFFHNSFRYNGIT